MIFKASFYLKIMCPKIEIPSNKEEGAKRKKKNRQEKRYRLARKRKGEGE
jgi:hypothetical protein